MVRMVPNVSHGCVASQSGSCNLMELTCPAADATISHATAQARNTNATKAVDLSASMRSASSCDSTNCCFASSAGCPCAAAASCGPARGAAAAAGASMRPISPWEKITSAAAEWLSIKFLHNDQKKKNSPVMDNMKDDSCMVTVSIVLKIIGGKFLMPRVSKMLRFFIRIACAANEASFVKAILL